MDESQEETQEHEDVLWLLVKIGPKVTKEYGGRMADRAISHLVATYGAKDGILQPEGHEALINQGNGYEPIDLLPLQRGQ